jgi:hypothetical protein
MNSVLYEFILCMSSLPYKFIHSSMTEPTIIPHSSVQGEHKVGQFVIDYLYMVLLFDAYTDHNAQASPAPWGGKYLSTDKEVKFGNKSESDMFQENQNVLIHFCMNQHEDIAWKFLVNKQEIRLVGLVRKLMNMVIECSIC